MNTNSHLKFACFITVRMGSTRLPRKALLPIRGRSIIEHLIDRTKLVKGGDLIVLCTSTRSEDDILEEIARKNEIECFRGSAEDKLARWLGAAEKFDVDYFVTVDGDDPFADPELIDLAIAQMRQNPCDFINIPQTLVCGGAEYCISLAALKKVCEVKNTDETEIMYTYFTDSGLFNVRDLRVDDRIFHNSNIRMTLDYQEDFDFFKRIFDELNIDVNSIPLRRIIELINRKPEIAKINFFRQEQYLANQKLKTKLLIKQT